MSILIGGLKQFGIEAKSRVYLLCSQEYISSLVKEDSPCTHRAQSLYQAEVLRPSKETGVLFPSGWSVWVQIRSSKTKVKEIGYKSIALAAEKY